MDDASDDPGMEEAFELVSAALTRAGIKYTIVRRDEHQFVAHTRNEVLRAGQEKGVDYACFMVSP